MASQVPPKRGEAYNFEVALVDQSDIDVFKTSPTLAAGDVLVSKDGGATSNISSLPTEIGSTGILKVTLTAAEMTADRVAVLFHDQTGDEWQDLLVTIQTVTDNQIDDLATATDLATVDSNVDAILLDTGTDGVKVADGAITAAKIATDAITADKIAADAITSSELADNAITAAKIASDAITAAKIASDAITADKIAASAITSSELADNAITAAKIATDAITADKIAADAITSSEIADNAITAAKIATDAITAAKIAADAITSSEFATSAAQEIADEILKRGVSNVESSADAHSLATIILATLESSLSGTTWTIKKTDGTTFTTKTVVTDPTAEPITSVT